jgi:DNA-binding MarR family transcriptional regulator
VHEQQFVLWKGDRGHERRTARWNEDKKPRENGEKRRMATRTSSEKLFGEAQRDEDRRWRAERRAREARRAIVERGWRERPDGTRGARATDVRKAEWLRSMRWRRQIQSVCSGLGLTFTQWLLLDSVRALIAETEDAVIQAEIAARLELDHATICEVTQRLEAKDLLSRGPDISCNAWRVCLTETAQQLLRAIDARVEAVSGNDG